MYFNLEQIERSLKRLEPFHIFYGTTLLLCKQIRLPVNETTEVSMDAEETNFFNRYYRPAPDSKWYYRVFRSTQPNKKWIDSRFPSTSSQTNRTKLQFAAAFIHEKDTRIWGWRSDYLEVLERNLPKGRKFPLFDAAVWLYRDRNWDENTELDVVLNEFIFEYAINEQEIESIFDLNLPDKIAAFPFFTSSLVIWPQLRRITGTPSDLPQDEGGTLDNLELQGVGPARKLQFKPAERMSLLTGDNGLGKTFLLECAWWVLTNQWAGLKAYPRSDTKRGKAKISFSIANRSGAVESSSVIFDDEVQDWSSPKRRPVIPGLLIYARVDGSFAVWDPARNRSIESTSNSPHYVFSRDDVWNGLSVTGSDGRERSYINGLLIDWVGWQDNPERGPFELFCKVLKRLSPPEQSDLGVLEPSEPIRIADEARLIPTLRHSYGDVPVIYAAAGVRRIITLAYLIVWAWNEHVIQSKIKKTEPQKRIVILIDEIEAHLHPQWQRCILPAILGIGEDLQSNDLSMQFLVATHSPLVTASVESFFDEKIDKLFHLDIINEDLFGQEVIVRELPFVRYGLINYWLISEVFELRHARSLPAEIVLEAAKAFQGLPNPSIEQIKLMTERLATVLAAEDPFWPRWTFFAESHGVEL